MSPVAEKIEQAFKRLAPREQVKALHRLESVVYGEEDPAFIAVLKRRVEEIKSGKVKGIDAFKALKRIRAKYSS